MTALSAHGDLTGSQVASLIEVKPETGCVFYKFSSRRPGPAGYIKPGTQATGGGYRIINLTAPGQKSRKVRAHHIVWMWVNGEWPKGEIDHINGNRDDNRIENLREASASQNRINKTIQRNNKTGFKWVRRHKDGYYYAEIAALPSMDMGRRRLHYSSHSTPEAAYAAACAAAKEIFGEWFNSGEKKIGG